MILYKSHRGSLAESMKTVQEVHNLEQLRQILVEEMRFSLAPIESFEIKFVYYCYDARIDWETYLVLAVLENSKEINCGFSNGVL